MATPLFFESYAQARAAFLEDFETFAKDQGLSLEKKRYVVDEKADLSIDCVAHIPEGNKGVFLCISGTHGIEGYTGNAIQRHVMQGILKRVDHTQFGICFVHGLNPWGFANFRRVNANNVDLNRNFQVLGEELYQSPSDGYEKLAGVLSPKRPFKGGLMGQLVFYYKMLSALAKNGMGALRQAILSGQYADPQGIFYGGDKMQPEALFFQDYYRQLLCRTEDILMVDLHTGYGERGQAYPLFGQADSDDFKQYTDEGVKTDGGKDKTYTARGELVRYCYETAKSLCENGIFNGLVLEMGTHGLKIQHQISDLQTVVEENQVIHHGAAKDEDIERAKAAFRSLFYPAEGDWQDAVLKAANREILGFLSMRGFLKD